MSRASRRDFLRTAALVAPLPLAVANASAVVAAGDETKATDIGSRRELFVDDRLIDRLGGKAMLRLHHPRREEIALVHDAAWEGSGSGYHSVFHDGTKYRMYYKAWHLDFSTGKLNTNTHPLYTCYAESDDGLRWTKPELGLIEFKGSKANNITIASGPIGEAVIDAGHPAVFRDDNPNAPDDARYKAIVVSKSPRGMFPLKSADGLTWRPLAGRPIITEGAFDSQNLAFWDDERQEYRAYWRIFTSGVTNESTWKPAGVRAIRTAASKDFLSWNGQADLTYADSPMEHLYTNQVKPYHRAPHLLVGFPTRYVERAWSDSLRSLPEREHRELRSKSEQRFGTAITEGLFMASRDGVAFKRWNEAFLQPGPEREGSWNYGDQYIAWHVVETKSPLAGAANELTLYASESYWTHNSSCLRRYTLRLDGFVSASAPMSGGELLTQPVRFAGAALSVNFATSAAGSLRVEFQDASGRPIPGFTLEDCPALFGDSVDRPVAWKSGGDVKSLAGQPVRLRFVLEDADLYAYVFGA
jgi:hypothetical protein